MGTKNVYMSDEDEALFLEAAELGGGLSRAVASGLRLFVASKHHEAAGLEPVEVKVDEDGVTVTKRFMGRRLLKHRQQSARYLVVTEIFETARRQFALYQRDIPTWTFSGTRSDGTGWGPEDYEAVTRSLTVFPTSGDLKNTLDPGQQAAFDKAVSGKLAEDLDI